MSWVPGLVSIIGFGRFGQLWASILKEDFSLLVHDPRIDICSIEVGSTHHSDRSTSAVGCGVDSAREVKAVSLADALVAEVIFYCVPISDFEAAIEEHMRLLAKTKEVKTLIDVLSVKTHPKLVFDRLMPSHFEAMLTHPMFGPDSVKSEGLEGQTIVVDRYRMSDEKYMFWKNYFARKNLRLVELSADEHDRLAARSQGVTHFVGRVLEEFGFEPTKIDTLGAKKLYEIKDQVCHDTNQLFVDLQTYNPHTRLMRVDICDAQTKIFNKLLPNRIFKDRLLVGIQGGRGSFNEQAAIGYLGNNSAQKYELVYYYTTDTVLKALHEGEVDRGQFAVYNSLGGIVAESLAAMARYQFRIVEEYSIKISHALMIAADAHLENIDQVMTHPQVLKQCQHNLSHKYANLKLTTGEGDLRDHARVALALSKKQLPNSVATIGSKTLANLYGLKVVEENLEDSQNNYTTFVFVERDD